MYIVTGGAGFIGSNIVKGLNQRGVKDILVVDDLTDGRKFANLVGCDIADYLDKDEFRARIRNGSGFGGAAAVFHQGACAVTTEWDGRYMMDNNYEYSKELLAWCGRHGARLIYASSAAVYGIDRESDDGAGGERPVNVYGYSKWLFDRYVTSAAPRLSVQVVGLRYFNVYGPGEAHKGSMASVVWHAHNQIARSGEVRLFAGSHGYGDGEQRRDFVHVGDVVAVNLWFLDHPQARGIFNVGTGRSRSFNDLARAVIAWHGRGVIRYIPFPDHLKDSYQSFTEARLDRLRSVGCDVAFRELEDGVALYLDRIERSNR
jgi:ADP-L-glycero-D-manno-heptose 6-epimerase